MRYLRRDEEARLRAEFTRISGLTSDELTRELRQALDANPTLRLLCDLIIENLGTDPDDELGDPTQ